MTLFEETSSDGTTRRCDARCYNAKGHACGCVCRGINHGVGLQRAVKHARAMAAPIPGYPDTDTRTWPRCLAYREDGSPCGKPAVAMDPEHGYPVCRRHYTGVQGKLVTA